MADHIHVSPAMFSQPVNDEQHGLYVSFRKPTLIIDAGFAYTLEIPFDMFH